MKVKIVLPTLEQVKVNATTTKINKHFHILAD